MKQQLSDMETQILEYLERARSEHGSSRITPDHPISGEKIRARFGLKSTAEVREIVHNIRSTGVFLASSAKGYYFALTWDEVRDTVQSLKARSRSVALPANAMLAKASKVDQLSLI